MRIRIQPPAALFAAGANESPERKSPMKEKEQDVSLPHGEDQIIKMDILGMIHRAESPFEII